MPQQTAATINTISTLALISIIFLGAFSRFTKGRYTPSFHAYQTDRAPNDDSTWIIQFVDLTLGSLLLLSKTRPWSALVGATLQGIGILKRVQEGKSATPDIGLFMTALVVALSSFARGRR